MAELIIFTLIVSLASVYSVLSEKKKIRMKASIGGMPLYILSILILSIFISYLSTVWLSTVKTDHIELFSLSLNEFHFTVAQTSVASLIFLSFGFILVRNSPKIRRKEYLEQELRRLYNREKYSVLAEVIHQYYDELLRHPKKPEKPSLVRIAMGMGADDDQYIIDDPKWQFRFNKVKYRLNIQFYRIRSTAEKPANFVDDIIADASFGVSHPLLKPELGLRYLTDETISESSRGDFSDIYLKAMIENKKSILYHEMLDIQKGERKLTNKLIRNSELAKEFHISEPIGDYTKRHLRDSNNLNYNEFRDRDEVRSKFNSDPAIVAIDFFDELVTAAFGNEMEWHYWIRYYYDFSQKICENVEITEESSPDSEYPNYNCRLLYEMIDNLSRWLKMVEKFDDSEENYGIYVRFLENREQTNIPKETVRTMIEVQEEIVMEDSVPFGFKVYITDIVVDRLRKLDSYDDGTIPAKYAEFMIEKISSNIEDSSEYSDKMGEIYTSNEGMNRNNIRHELMIKSRTDLKDRLDEILLN